MKHGPQQMEHLAASSVSMKEWYYIVEGEPHGPITEGDLKDALRQGQLPQSVFVFSDGMTDWLPAETVASLIPRETEGRLRTARGFLPGWLQTQVRRLKSCKRLAWAFGGICLLPKRRNVLRSFRKAVLICVCLTVLNFALLALLAGQYFKQSQWNKGVAAENRGIGAERDVNGDSVEEVEVAAYLSALPAGEVIEINKPFTQSSGSKRFNLVLETVATGQSAATLFGGMRHRFIETSKTPTYLKVRIANREDWRWQIYGHLFKARDSTGNEYDVHEAPWAANDVHPGGTVTKEFLAMLPANARVAYVSFASHEGNFLVEVPNLSSVQQAERPDVHDYSKGKDAEILRRRGLSDSEITVAQQMIRRFGFTIQDVVDAWDEAKRTNLIGRNARFGDPVILENLLRVLSAQRDMSRP